MRRFVPLFLLVALIPAARATAGAQSSSSASVTVTATVLDPLTSSVVRSLSFGKVGQGTNKTIAPGNAASGGVEFTGTNAAGINITFTLPTTLAGPSAATMDIGSYAAEWGGGSLGTGSAQAFTPSPTVTPAGVIFPAGTGTQKVWVRFGATVAPTGAQTPGTYSGTVGVTAIYNEI